MIQPLYERLYRCLQEAGLTPTGPGIAHYEESAGDDSVLVHASLPVSAPPDDHEQGFTVRDLPAVDTAATVVHRGSMDRVMPTLQALARWVEANGYRQQGPPRELQLDCGEGPETWVTELQQPVTRA